MEFSEPILMMSDLHLAHPASYLKDPAELVPLIRQVGAKTVIFNGDSAEMRLEHAQERGREMARRLEEECEKHGAKAVFVNGNHDPLVADDHVLEMAGGQVMVTHGHVLFPQIVPWSREAKSAWKEHRNKLEEHGGVTTIDDPGISLEDRFKALQEACLAYETAKVERNPSPFSKMRMVFRELWPPTRPFIILRIWMQTPGLARRFAERYFPDARFIIIGHTHRAGVWTKDGRTVVNLGSFTPLSGRLAVVIQEGKLRVHSIREDRDGAEHGWKLGESTFDAQLELMKQR